MLVSKGITDIYISVYYLSDQIIEYFGDGNKFDCNMCHLRELSPLGTAGALGLLDKMEQNTNILVLNGDLHVDFNLQDANIPPGEWIGSNNVCKTHDPKSFWGRRIKWEQDKRICRKTNLFFLGERWNLYFE